MSIKILIKFEGNLAGALEKSSKLGVPKSWQTKTVGDVIGLFTKAYNAKSDIQLVKEEMHLLGEDGEKIYSDAQVSTTLGDHCDYILKPGVHIKHTSTTTIPINAAGKQYVKCKNYGCQKYFDEDASSEENTCQHHTGPPIFHDTIKYWSCCEGTKAYDFEGFQLIKGCNAGTHSTVDPSVSIHSRHTVFEGAEEAGKVVADAQPILKSISDFNEQEGGPTAAGEFGRILRQERKSSRNEADGTAKCQRKGCGQTFLVEGNNIDTACTFHQGQPIFHDAVKFWSCCPNKKCYDFDSFMAVPGCSQGLHDDGVIIL